MTPLNLRYFTFYLLGLLSFGLSLSCADEFNIECFKQNPIFWTSTNETKSFKADCSKRMLHNITNIFDWLHKNVTILDVSYNYIEFIPLLPELSNLRTLNLRGNNVKTLEEKAFSNLRRLEVLDLSHNFLTGLTLRPDVLRGNFSSAWYEPLPIKVILLGYNRIQSLNYRVFEHLPHLLELRLDGNPLGTAEFSLGFNTQLAIQSVISLKTLDLSKTGISTIPKELFTNMQLQRLYICGNSFSQVPKELNPIKKSLEYININENPITELNFDSFLGLNNLKEIVASGNNNLTAIKAGTFTHLENLESITCSYNSKLSYINENAFSVRSNYKIKNVHLNNNKLHTLPQNLLPWAQLEKLELGGNEWSCDCRNQWLIDFDQQENQTLLKHSELLCWEPTWLNGTSFEVLKHPFGKFLCDEKTKHMNDVIAIRSALDFCILLIFIALIFFASGLIVHKLATQKSDEITDCATHSRFSSQIKYNKLDDVRIS